MINLQIFGAIENSHRITQGGSFESDLNLKTPNDLQNFL
jgi:hypothetical protein